MENFGSYISTWFLSASTSVVGRIAEAVILVVIGLIVVQILVSVAKTALEKSKLEKAAHSLILSVLRVVGYVLLVFIVASALGIDMTGVVALASVLTLAVSLALQNMFSNVVGGFVLLYTKPFTSGDFVEIAGQSGSVVEVGMTYTKLRTLDNKIAHIPNSSVVSAEIINYTVAGTRRVDINVCASYTEPVDKVIESLRGAANMDCVLTDPAPFAAVASYEESTVKYVLQFWVKSDDYWAGYFGALNNIKGTFLADGVQMSYPHLNIHVDK